MSGTSLPAAEAQLLNDLRDGLRQDAAHFGSALLGKLADKVQDYGEKEQHFLSRCGADG